MSKSTETDEYRTLDSDTLKEVHEYSLDLDTNRIYLEGSWDSAEEDVPAISWVTARRFRKNLMALIHALTDTEEDQTIVVDIDTPGGDEQAGLSIYDAVVACPLPIVGYVSGEASSMGCVILQAFPDRVLARHAGVMYHPGGAGVDVAASEFRAAADYVSKLGSACDQIVYDRMRTKNPALTREQFDLRVVKGLYLTAQEAVDLGLADRIS